MTIMEHVNGHRHQQGRAVPPLPEHTFQDSGITIRVRKIGPTTQQRQAQQLMREMPDPPMPVVETEAGPEANPADPDWIAACEKREHERRSELTNRLMRAAALEAEVTIDDQARIDIARRKRTFELTGIPWLDDPQMTPEENDRVFYVLNVCAATPEDLGEFGAAVLRRSVPTEAAVQAQIDTFPGDVSGA